MTLRFQTLALYLAVALSSSAAIRYHARDLGGTFDEPFHLHHGLAAWRTGSNKPLMTAGAMPLPFDVQTLPVYLIELAEGRPVDTYGRFAELIPVARAGNLAFWWLLLAYAWRWGDRLGGVWGGRFALLAVAWEPNFQAHAALAGSDIAALSTALVATYHGSLVRLGVTEPESRRQLLRRLLVPGLTYGLALCAKASALAFVPLVVLALTLQRWDRAAWANWRRALWPLTRDALVITAIALAVVFGYCGCDWSTEPTFIQWVETLPPGTPRDALGPVARNLAIFPNGGEALVQQVKHNSRGHGSYVLGEYHPRAVWYYFPVALSAKLPLATLALLALVLAARPRTLVTHPAGLATLVLLAFSLTCRVQIGVRLVFPLVAFLLIWLSTAWPTPTRANLAARAALVLGLVGTTLWTGGDGLRFTNPLWGGPERGREIYADSNCDWGQGLPQLKAWHAARPEALHVWYYGADPAIFRAPFVHCPAHLWPEADFDALKRRLIADTRGGVLAVSFSLLDACPARRPELLALLDWLKAQPEVGRTGTFVVYRLGGA